MRMCAKTYKKGWWLATCAGAGGGLRSARLGRKQGVGAGVEQAASCCVAYAVAWTK